MSPEQFAYWLQGYTEITNGQQPDATQWQIIVDHLKSVFHKETPERYPVSALDAFSALTGKFAPTYCSSLLPQRSTFDWNDGTPKLFVTDHTC